MLLKFWLLLPWLIGYLWFIIDLVKDRLFVVHNQYGYEIHVKHNRKMFSHHVKQEIFKNKKNKKINSKMVLI